MESNNNNLEIIFCHWNYVLSCLDMPKENNNEKIITPNLESSNSTFKNIESYISEKCDQVLMSHSGNQIISEIKVLLKNHHANDDEEEEWEKNFLKWTFIKRNDVMEKCKCLLDEYHCTKSEVFH